MKDEALKLALEALETLMIERGSIYDKAITAIREALAQPEQHQDWCASLTQMLMSMPPKPAPCNCKPPQRTWIGLTDEEVESLQRLAIDPVDANGWGFLNRERYAYLIEAKLKELNT